MTAHLDDAALIAHLDHADEPGGRNDVSDHLSSCLACRRRYATVRSRSERLATWFTLDGSTTASAPEGPPPPREAETAVGAATTALPGGEPVRRPTGRWLGAAASVALLLGLTVLTPLGATLSDWISAVRSGNATSGAVDEPAGAGRASTVVFPVPEPMFRVSFEGAPGDGTLIVRVDDVPSGSVVVRGGADPGELTVLADGLQVRPGVDAAEYEIVLPATVLAVAVSVDGTPVTPRWTPGPTAVPRRWIVRLQR